MTSLSFMMVVAVGVALSVDYCYAIAREELRCTSR